MLVEEIERLGDQNARLRADNDRLRAANARLRAVNAMLTRVLPLAETDNRRLREALIRLRDCDWTITLPDRMDAVRDIARQAISQGVEVSDV